jgi:hypothetical protein
MENLVPAPETAHLVCFTLLAIGVQASRFPWRREILLAVLIGYALAAEALQYFVPPRQVELEDFALNLSGLVLGTVLWRLGAGLTRLKKRNSPAQTEEEPVMAQKECFHVITREGELTADLFVVVADQPLKIKKDCLLVVNVQDGSQVTVHKSRLVRTENAEQMPLAKATRSACLKCGKVAGVVEDQVTCPNEKDAPCKVLEARSEKI